MTNTHAATADSQTGPQAELTEQQLMIRDTVHRIAEEHFKPNAARADRERRPPVENLKVLAKHGFTGTFIPEEYGGGGLGTLECALVFEQVARSCANTAILLGATDGSASHAILHLGSDEHKKRYLPRFATGDLVGGWGMSEPDGGSDVGAVKTRAVRDGSDYLLTGSKIWCSGAQLADVFVVIARLSDEPGMRGVGAVIIERGTPGFTIGEHLDLIGLRATGMAPLFFDRCRLPAENVLVQAGDMRRMFSFFDAERIVGNPSVCLGVAEAAFEGVVAYVKERKQFGRALADFQGLQWRLADMAIEIEAARAMLYRAARRVDAGRLDIWDASATKVYCNEMGVRVTNMAMQLAGAFGLSQEYPFERHFRDVRGMSIGYGTTEIHRNQIAQEILRGNYRF